MRRLVDPVMVTATVQDLSVLGDGVRAVALGGPNIGGLTVTPGQQVRVQVGTKNPLIDKVMGALRTYSIWDYNDELLHLRVFDHGDGPGARWSRTLNNGDTVHLLKPQGDFVCRPSAYHLFVGDETASVAFGAMIRGLNNAAPAYTVIEVDSEHEQLPIDADVNWLYRRGRTAVNSTQLVEAVARLDLPPTPGTAYLAGEASTIQLTRNHLVRQRGWNRRDILTKPFWAQGKTGLE
jgi:NADPH-dependent ferric siderophore reductase